MADILFPYKTLPDEVRLIVDSAEFDTGTALNDIDAASRLISLRDRTAKYKSLTLGLTITAPAAEVAAMEGDGSERHPLTAVVVAKCGPANLRQVVRLDRTKSSVPEWKGTLELSRHSFRGTVQLRAVVAADQADYGGTRQPRPFCLVGASEEWQILSQLTGTPPPGRGGSLPVKWVSFADPNLPHLHDHKSLPFYVELNGSFPEVQLNLDFPGLISIFPQQGAPGGALRPLHEAERTSIARATWLAMFQTALAAIVTDTDTDSVDWPSDTWKKNVLTELLPRIYPGTEPREALRQVAQDREDGTASLQSRLLLAVSKLSQEDKNLARAINDVTRLAQDQEDDN